MLIVDAHLDLSWNGVQGGRDLRRSVAEIREAELEGGLEGPGRGLGTVALPELREGRVAVSVATVFARCTGTVIEGVDYATVAEATAAARAQLAWYRGLEAEGELRVIETAAALEAHLREWQAWERAPTTAQPLLGIVLAMEGADPIATPADVDEWFEAGIRMIGLTHYGPGRYAGGTETEVGLSSDAPALLTAMDFHARTAVMLVHAWNATPEQCADFNAFGDALAADTCGPGVRKVKHLRETNLYLAWCDGDPKFLDMTIEDALALFAPVPAIARKLETLVDVGLSYIKLGQSATTLSGGEAQRVKLSRELSRRDTGRTLYLLDEPTTGLHFHDIEHLLAVLHRLRDEGNTIVVIEHNLDVIKTADWIVDLGPEGGHRGGTIVATGTPEDIAAHPTSHTGRFLAPHLQPRPRAADKPAHRRKTGT